MLRPESPAPADLLGSPPASPAALGMALAGVAARLGKALGAEATRDFATRGSDAHAAKSPDLMERTDTVAGLLAERRGPLD